jgi:4a-hydroxytetrahydrobiopterin dehydratase
MNDWQIKDTKLFKEYKFKDYSEAFSFVSQVSDLAEKANHHPDISFGWGYVQIRLYSHDEKSITERDHKLAKQISSLSVVQ